MKKYYPFKIIATVLVLTAVFFVLSFAWVGSAQAMMLKVSEEELIIDSDLIVVGVVKEINSKWNDERDNIYSVVTIYVNDIVGGGDYQQDEITIIVPGGKVGDISQINSLSPVMNIGQEVLLYLQEYTEDYNRTMRITKADYENSLFTVNSYFQGKKDIVEGKINGIAIDIYQAQIESIQKGETEVFILDIEIEKKRSATEQVKEARIISGDTFFRKDNIETSEVNDQIFVSQSPYLLNGQQWPSSSIPVKYKVNTSGGPSGSLSAIQDAAGQWSNAGANFSFSYDGSHSRINGFSQNYVNEVLFYNSPTSELGQATWWFTSSGTIVEADFYFNTKYNWSTAGSNYDVQTVAMHELGHWLSLGHSSNSDAVMYAFYQGLRRTLHPDDIAGIRAIYGTSSGPISLGDAVDAPNLPWYTGGDADWFGQSMVTYDGVDAAQSGLITHNQSTWMETIVTGPGTISFWWKVSSEIDYDWLFFAIDGNGDGYYDIIDGWSGETDWIQFTYEISSGTNSLLWVYEKDYIISSGSDCGWVDQVVWTPSSAGADLVVQSVTVSPETSTLGQELTATIVIKNQGTADVTDSFWLDLYLHRESAPEPYEDGNYWWQVDGLAAGASDTYYYYFTPDSAGTYKAWAQVDSYLEVSESSHVFGPVNYTVQTEPTGSIQVNIEPASARSEGAQWRLTSITQSSSNINKFSTTPRRDLANVPYDAMEGDVLRVKFKPVMTQTLDRMKIATSAHGIAVTGIEEIDSVNAKYGARLFKSLIEPLYIISEASSQYRDQHRDFGLHLWYEIHIDSSRDIKEVIASYNKLESIEIAEPVYKKVRINQAESTEDSQLTISTEREPLQSSWTPDDPLFSNQWHFHNTGQHSGTPGADIDLINAWDIEKGNPDVVVAIVDSGIQYNHPDLATNMWPGIGPDGTGTLPDDHGTHVAGTIAAVTNNSDGVAGIAGGSGSGNGVRIMSIDIFDGNHGLSSLALYVYQADNGVAISQNSWIFKDEGNFPQDAKDGIDYFNIYGGGSVLDGGLTIFAAGNENSSGNWYPACYEGVMAVAATNNQDIKASYSNYGSWIEISAPGGETTSVLERGVLSTITGNNYYYYRGTSMACPHVSGVAALMVSLAPGQFASTEIRSMLKETTDNHYTVNPGYTGMLGSGRLNAYQALLKVQSEMGEPNDWKDSGETIAGLTPGTYTITFKEIPGWDKPGDVQLTVTGNQVTSFTGIYSIKSYTINLAAEPPDGGNAYGQGAFNHGEEITVTAVPNPGYEFVNWTEDGTEVHDQTAYTFTAEADRDLVANFIAVTSGQIDAVVLEVEAGVEYVEADLISWGIAYFIGPGDPLYDYVGGGPIVGIFSGVKYVDIISYATQYFIHNGDVAQTLAAADELDQSIVEKIMPYEP